jgi:hypothetical protein
MYDSHAGNLEPRICASLPFQDYFDLRQTVLEGENGQSIFCLFCSGVWKACCNTMGCRFMINYRLYIFFLSSVLQFRVESMMLRLAKPLNYVPVSPSIQQRARMRAPGSLPLIMEPHSRYWSYSNFTLP